ncbi:MAG: hypothetical protein JXR25_05780, partial [Pontiellaceae bacterium]|nr:hypothetical protein [Pontiellaceae bacterium]
ISRYSDGSRRISRISEVTGMERDLITVQDLFEFRQTGIEENGRVLGALQPTGVVPSFVDDVGVRGITLDREMFNPGRGR